VISNITIHDSTLGGHYYNRIYKAEQFKVFSGALSGQAEATPP